MKSFWFIYFLYKSESSFQLLRDCRCYWMNLKIMSVYVSIYHCMCGCPHVYLLKCLMSYSICMHVCIYVSVYTQYVNKIVHTSVDLCVFVCVYPCVSATLSANMFLYVCVILSMLPDDACMCVCLHFSILYVTLVKASRSNYKMWNLFAIYFAICTR